MQIPLELAPESNVILRNNNLQYHYASNKSKCRADLGATFDIARFTSDFLLAAKGAKYLPHEVINAHFAMESPGFLVNSAQCIGVGMSALPENSWADMVEYLKEKFDISVKSVLPSDGALSEQLDRLDHYANILGITRFSNDQQIANAATALIGRLGGDETNEAERLRSTYREARDWMLANSKKSFRAMEMLNGMVGLHNAKKEVYRLTCLFQAQMMRRGAGVAGGKPSMHLVFAGNPGTGKTTVARLVGQIYKSLGLLSEGHVIEADRSSLVAEYLGQTASKTKSIVRQAAGGVLFIDEAYALAGKGDDSYGEEAVNTLLKEMEDRRDAFAVIIAGYTNEMGRFISSNPGLKSRFSRTIHFEDYSADELANIFMGMVKDAGMTLGVGAEEKIRSSTSSLVANKGADFGNAREIRTMFEITIENQAVRIIEQGSDDICIVAPEDVA